MNMKIGSTIVLFFLAGSVTAQQDTAHTDILRLPDSSAIGEAVGNGFKRQRLLADGVVAI